MSVLAVLLFHAGYAWAQGGFLGVSTFFTLSGFLITRSLLEERARDGGVDLPTFWARRLRRLMPAALAGLLLVAAFAAFAAHVTQRMRATEDGLAALVYLSNWWFIVTDSGYQGLLGHPSPVQHFWSLSIEEQFYAVYPLLLLALLGVARRSERAAGGGIALLVLAGWAWLAHLAGQGASTERIYYGTDTRCAELLVGCALALWLPQGRMAPGRAARLALGVAGVAGALASLYAWTSARVESDALYRGGLQVYALASAAILASVACAPGRLAALLSLPPVRWLGRISYGVYVYHWPIYLWLDETRTGLAGHALTAVRIGLTLFVAHVSYSWLEEPVRSGRRPRGAGVALTTLAGMACLALALGVATRGVEPAHPVSGTLSGLWRSEPAAPPSVRSDEDGLRILVVGDSVAKQLAAGLRLSRGSAGKGGRVVSAAADGCGLARGAHLREPTRRQRICDDWDGRYRVSLEKARPDVVLVYVSGWDLVPRRLPEWDEEKTIDAPEFAGWLRREYEEAVDLLSATGAHVAWITPLCTQLGEADRHARGLLVSEVLTPVAAAFADRMTLVDLDAAVCPGGRFTNRLDGIEPFRPDGNHFSMAGRLWVGLWLWEHIERVLDRARLTPHTDGE